MSDDTTTESAEQTTKKKAWGGGGGLHSAEVKKYRTLAARVLWGICVVFALILAIAVLLIAIDANYNNGLVSWITDRAANVDLGFFSLTEPIKDWDDKKDGLDDVKTVLFNYGIAAIVWLIIGKIVEKLVKP